MTYSHIQKVTALVGGTEYIFRSKLEYRYAVFLELLKAVGEIQEWLYEAEEVKVDYKDGTVKIYRPDFSVMIDDELEFHETKGFFKAKDVTLMKNYCLQYDTPLTLIFARKPTKMQLRRAQRLEPYLKRLILNADKELFEKIKFMFDY